MIQYYLWIKWIHIISSTFLMGTGIGIAFFMLMSYLRKDIHTIRTVSSFVILADWLFTAPAVIIQFVSGMFLVHILNYSLSSIWFVLTLSLFLFVGVCWLPVLWIQYQFRREAALMMKENTISQRFHRLMRTWITLGCFAFTAMIGIFYVMVFKPGLSFG